MFVCGCVRMCICDAATMSLPVTIYKVSTITEFT